jgi:hypothetical protein
MKSHALVRRHLPLASVAARFLLVAFLVFATVNPSHYSILTWILSDSPFLNAKAVIAFGLALSWLILLRISLAGLGWLGFAYVALAFVVLALVEMQFELLHLFSPFALVIMAQFALAIVLTFGLVFSYWVRQASGQSAIVKRPP